MDDLPALTDEWFTHGVLEFTSGKNTGQKLNVLGDRSVNNERRVVINQELPFAVVDGDQVWLTVGCDKSLTTCRDKFQNAANFQGFPHIPGEDWMMSVPTSRAV
jgi:uncharacterized phage protein (TIGR02218 family)